MKTEPLERTSVTVIEEPNKAKPARKRPGAVGQILDAIAAMPKAVAAEIGGKSTASGAAEVRFVGDPLPEDDGSSDDALSPDGAAPDALPDGAAPHRPRFTHPSARRRTTEAIV